MNISCPKCKTVFDFSSNIEINKKFKCSVCNHIWLHKKNVDEYKGTKTTQKSGYKNLIILNIIIILLAIFVFFIFRDHLEIVDYYWKYIYLFFDNLIPIQ